MSLESRLGLFITRVGTEIKSLRSADAAKADAARLISAGTGLTGGGSLAADRSLAVSYGTASGTAVQGNDSRVDYVSPVVPTMNTAKFNHFSTAADYQNLRIWKQGRMGFAAGLIRNTVDLGFGAHIVLNAGIIPAAMRPRAAPLPGATYAVGNCSVLDKALRVDIAADGRMIVGVGVYTIATGSTWAINCFWPLD